MCSLKNPRKSAYSPNYYQDQDTKCSTQNLSAHLFVVWATQQQQQQHPLSCVHTYTYLLQFLAKMRVQAITGNPKSNSLNTWPGSPQLHFCRIELTPTLPTQLLFSPTLKEETPLKQRLPTWPLPIQSKKQQRGKRL